MSSIGEVWARLREVVAVAFEARTDAQTGWDGIGGGTVAVSEPADGLLVFEESGSWQPRGRANIRFSNVFRWTRLDGSLRLEHLRFGPDRPIFLFDLVPGPDGAWREVSPHECGADCYSGTLRLDGQKVLMDWSVRGPRKAESISYVYQ